MSVWTTSTQANARPEQVLEVLTDPQAIRLWSAGALDGAARGIARAAERPCMPALA